MAMLKLGNQWSTVELKKKTEETKIILFGLIQLLYICDKNVDIDLDTPSFFRRQAYNTAKRSEHEAEVVKNIMIQKHGR